MTRLRLLLCGLVFAPLLASADPKTADEWYKQGENEYNLGNFEKAAEDFKQGFSLETTESKKPAYLFNIAQSYRQANKCRDAAFFYKRYLALKDQAGTKPLSPDKRAQIEGFITELEECAKNQEKINPPPAGSNTGTGQGSAETTDGSAAGSATTDTHAGSGTRVATGGGEGSDGEEDGGVHTTVEVNAPKVLTARFTGGGAKITAGGLNVPLQGTGFIGLGYPVVRTPGLVVDVGVGGSITSLKFTNTFSGESKNGSISEVLANVGASYGIGSKLAVRGDLGAGMMFLGGINEMGNPFTEAGAATSGTLAMFAVRAAVSADYLITPNVFATITPFAFSYSPPKKGLREDIKSITQIDFMAGLGYRM